MGKVGSVGFDFGEKKMNEYEDEDEGSEVSSCEHCGASVYLDRELCDDCANSGDVLCLVCGEEIVEGDDYGCCRFCF